MEDNEMEWEKRPMLGAQRIYLQYEADVLMSTRARKSEHLRCRICRRRRRHRCRLCSPLADE